MLKEMPLTGFSFRVDFGIPGMFTSDIAFQKVSGISMKMKFKDVEVGADRGSIQVPDGVEFGDLVLERGMMKSSILISWFQAQVVGKMKIPIPVILSMYGPEGWPVFCWTFINAYPIEWSTDGFDAQTSGIVVEKITFKYSYYVQEPLASAADFAQMLATL